MLEKKNSLKDKHRKEEEEEERQKKVEETKTNEQHDK
jgi:hypothetical protein